MKALTNEVFYLFNEDEGSMVKPKTKKVMGGSKPLDPKIPQSPAFYSSSDYLESSTFQIVSSKEQSSNGSQGNKRSEASSNQSDILASVPTSKETRKNSKKNDSKFEIHKNLSTTLVTPDNLYTQQINFSKAQNGSPKKSLRAYKRKPSQNALKPSNLTHL